MRSIFLHIGDDSGLEERLAVALDLTRAHNSHLTCVQTSQLNSLMLIQQPLDYGMSFTARLLDDIEAASSAERARIEERLRNEGVPWDWIRIDNDAPFSLIREARLADLLVLSRETDALPSGPPPLRFVGDVVIHAGTPVLVVPPGAKGISPDGPAVVAWNGSMEAAHSLRLALSHLRMATEVHVVTVPDDNLDLPAAEANKYLARHDVSSVLHERPRKGRDVSEVLVEAARELGATTIVMGAYGHSRLRETILGGVTRELLRNASIPLLLAH